MLRAVLSLLALCLAAPSWAEAARVIGGEHDDFTRIVVEATGAGDWRFGRAIDGYELQLGPEVTAYDVTRAFEKIPKDRVTAIWKDPETDRLRISLACQCHAIAFEFRKGIVVVDIKNGPPSAGSTFEEALDLVSPPPPDAEETTDGNASAKGATYDWVDMMRTGEADPAEREVALPLPTGEVSLDPLRDALLAQISRGAAQGVIEIDPSLPPPDQAVNPSEEDGPWSRVGLGELPGLATSDPRDAKAALTAAGKQCLKDGDLDVASWGRAGSIAEQVGLARSGLLSEFDAPDPVAIRRAAEFHVFLGFGAEARQVLDFLNEPAASLEILRAMAHIVDGEPAEPNPFAGMEVCDSAAALWATLADPDPGRVLPGTNAAAVARSFSSLPPHLRRHLGGSLVERFLASGDEETARLLRDAIKRLPAEGDSDVEMMDARYHLAEGDADSASRLAEGVLQAAGPAQVEAALTLVDAAFQGNRQIDPGLPAMLEAFLFEAKGTDREAALKRALVLSLAMAGDYGAAFDRVEQAPETFANLWLLSGDAMPDDLFLEQAAEYARTRPGTSQETDLLVARRLLGLGFPDLALSWLGKVGAADTDDRRVLAARAHLALRDAPAAMEVLAGLTGPEAERLWADALMQAGDPAAAAERLALAGDEAMGQRAVTWTQDWPLIAAEGPADWREAAGMVDQAGPDSAAPGPIARGTALAEESAAARAAIEGLLESLTAPPPTQ